MHKTDAKGTTVEKEVNTYNAQGKLAERKTYNAKGLELHQMYSYDNNGKRISEEQKDAKGNTVKKTTYKYNKEGYRSERTQYDAKGKITEVKHYEYKYR